MYDEETLRRYFGRTLNKCLKDINMVVLQGHVPFEVQIDKSVVVVNRQLLLDYLNEKVKEAMIEGVKFAYDNKI